MKKRNTKLHILALYLLLPAIMVSIHSCEYSSSDDNFVILEKPDEQVQIGIDLAGVNPEEIIYVYPSTLFYYSLFTQDREVFVRQFYLDGEPIETDQHNGTCNISTDISDTKIHELKLVIALKTNTGSLAENVGLEMYVGEFNFKIKFISHYNELNIKETIDSNNYLKLEWDKPQDCEVWGYEVYHGDVNYGKLLTRITNPDETFFSDTDYAYGYKFYTVVAFVKNSFNITFTGNIYINYENFTEKHFEMQRTALNEAFMQWKNPNPFPSKYVIVFGNEDKMVIGNGLSEATIPVAIFPSWGSTFKLYIIPESADIEQFESYQYIYVTYRDKELSAIDFKGDPAKNMLYSLSYESMFESYDLTTMKKISSVKTDISIHSGCKLQVTNKGMVAIEGSRSNVHIYSDCTLSKKMNVFNSQYYPFHLVDGNKLLIEERYGFKIYDITTGNIICNKDWQLDKEYGEIIPTTIISHDGKYIFVICRDYTSTYKEWLELYEMGADNSLKLLGKIETQGIQSATFHSLKNSTVIIQYLPYLQNKFEVMDIHTNEKKVINGEFMNIDPFTGNLLLRGEDYRNGEHYLYVLNKNYLEEIFKLEISDEWNASYLFNNYLFTGSRYVNLSGLKEWKKNE